MTKQRIFHIIQVGQDEDTLSRSFDLILVCMILINISVMFLQTFDQFQAYTKLFQILEFISIVFFCIEYGLRIWTSEYLFPGRAPWKSKLLFMKSFDGLVELFTILPFFFLSGFVAFRMLRVVRIFHLFRINAQYDSFNVITSVIYEKRNQILSSLFIIIVLMFASSLCMYNVEHSVQPENFQNAFSGLWWSMSTLLTVGYGDIYPITTLGKAMAIVISFLGVGTVAIPTGIISAGFVEQYNEMQNTKETANDIIQTIVIDMDSSWLNQTVHSIQENMNVRILLVKRRSRIYTQEFFKDLKISVNDIVYIYQDKSI